MFALILLQQMLILFAMALCGFLAVRRNWIRESGKKQFSALIVHLFNPILIISSVSAYDASAARGLIGQNLVLLLLVFGILIAAGFVYVRVRRLPRRDASLYHLAIAFNNVGFMGLPLVRGALGEQYLIFVVFYMLVFNILIYTFGILLAGRMSDTGARFSLKKILSTGTFASVAAILIFLFDVRFPAPVKTFLSYMGDVTIPVSMIIIGASLATQNLRRIFLDAGNYLFTIVKMGLIPLLAILLLRKIPFDRNVVTLACIMVSMPVASFVGMLSEEYGGDAERASALIAMTTVFSVVSVPLLSLAF